MPFKSTLFTLFLLLGTQALPAQILALAAPAAPQPTSLTPATAEVVSLDMTFATESIVTVEVRDALGQVLVSSQVIYPAGKRTVKVSLGEVEEGVYFVQAATEEEAKSQMVVIDRHP